MSFTWDPPAESLQNGDILSYTLSCTQNLELAIRVVLESTVQEFSINLFSPGTAYQCEIYSTNIIGNGPAAQLSISTESKNSSNFISSQAI